MSDTKYARQIKAVTGPSGEAIERIFVKERKQEEIRFSYWPNGRFVPRALDVTEEELTALLGQAMNKDVFSKNFLKKITHYDRQCFRRKYLECPRAWQELSESNANFRALVSMRNHT